MIIVNSKILNGLYELRDVKEANLNGEKIHGGFFSMVWDLDLHPIITKDDAIHKIERTVRNEYKNETK